MTCPVRRYDNGSVLTCGNDTHPNPGYHIPSMETFYTGDPWSYDASCRKCGGTGKREFVGPNGPDYDMCAYCAGTGVLPLEVVPLAPWVGATLRHKEWGDALVTATEDEHGSRLLVRPLPNDVDSGFMWLWPDDVGVGKPWQVIAPDEVSR